MVPDWFPPKDNGYRLGPTYDSCWFHASKDTNMRRVQCDAGYSELSINETRKGRLVAVTVGCKFVYITS